MLICILPYDNTENHDVFASLRIEYSIGSYINNNQICPLICRINCWRTIFENTNVR